MQENIIGYHATDATNIDSILLNNFNKSHNEDDWLGGGSYFFIDLDLAKKWSNKPTNKYGKIKTPAYLYVNIEVEKERLCDARYLHDFNLIKKSIDFFYNSILYKNLKLKQLTYKNIRCAFIDWVAESYGIECIVAYFDDRHNLSIKTKHDNEFDKMLIPYVEVQICVKNNSVITKIEKIDL